MADGYLNFDTKINTKGFNNGLSSISNGLGKVKNAFSGIAKIAAAAFSVKMLVDFGKKAVELASDLEEVQNVVDVSFGDMAYKMEAFADSAMQMYGISRLSAKQTGSTLMAMARGMGLAAESASDMALQLTALSADMASFYNKSQEETFTALKSIFTGETETLKRYGIVMTEANLQAYAFSQGINKQISAMTQAEKVQLRYNYVMQQTALAQGDFARTSGSWANQIKLAKMQFQEFASQIGVILKNIILPAVKTLNNVLGVLIQGATRLVAVFSKLFGWETQTSNTASKIEDSTSSTAGNVKDTTTALKKNNKEAEKFLGTYDKLNVIQKETASNADDVSDSLDGLEIPTSGGYDIVGTLDIDTTKADEKIDGLIERVKKMFETSDFSELGQGLRDKIVSTLKSVDFDELTNKTSNVAKSLATFINGIFDKDEEGKYSLSQSVGKFIGDSVKMAIDTIDSFVANVDFTDVGGSIIALFENIDYSGLDESFTSLTESLASGLWDLIKGAFGELGNWIKGNGDYSQSLWDLLWFAIKQAVFGIYRPMKFVADFLASAFGYDSFGDMMGEFGDAIKEAISNEWDTQWKLRKEFASELFVNVKGKLDIEAFKKWFKEQWTKITDWWNGKSGTTGENEKSSKKLELKLKFQAFKTWLKDKWKAMLDWWNNSEASKSSTMLELKLKFQAFKDWLKEKWSSVVNWWNGTNGEGNKDGNKLTLKLKLQAFKDWLKEKWKSIKDNWAGKNHDLGIGLKLPSWSDFVTKLKNFVKNIIDWINAHFVPKLQSLFSIGVKDNAFTQLTVPDFAGKTYPIVHIPKIPPLATGTVVPANYGEFLSILGDNRKAPEIVSPVPEMKRAMSEVLTEFGNVSKEPINLIIGGKQIAQLVWNETAKRYKQTGKAFV